MLVGDNTLHSDKEIDTYNWFLTLFGFIMTIILMLRTAENILTNIYIQHSTSYPLLDLFILPSSSNISVEIPNDLVFTK